MNANRKADLQRKLSLAPVPKPPAGLAERIKSDIPKQLRFDAEKERQRFSRAVTFNLAVAASVLILISSAYLALHLMTRVEDSHRPGAADRITILPARTRRAQSESFKPPAAVAAAPKLQKRAAPKKKQAPLIAEMKDEEKNEVRREAAATPPPPPAAPVAAEAQGMNQAAKVRALSSVTLDTTETTVVTTSPVSGEQMLYSPRDKRVDVVDAKQTRKRIANKVTPWAELPREMKLKILETELARGGDRKVIARLAREAGLDAFAESIERR